MVEIKISLVDGSLLEVRNLEDSPQDEIAFDGFVDFLAREGIKYLENQEEKKNEKSDD